MNQRVRSLIRLTLMIAAACPLHEDVEGPEVAAHQPGGVRRDQPAPGGHEDVEHLPPRPLPRLEPVLEVAALHEVHRDGDLIAPKDDLVPRDHVRVGQPRVYLSFAAEAGARHLGVLLPAFAGPAEKIPFITGHHSVPVLAELQCGASLAASVPNHVNASIDCKMRQLGFSVGGGLVSYKFGIPSLDARAWIDTGNIEARLRWYPFGGVFFLGGALGYQSIHLKVEKDVEVNFGLWTETVTATVELQTRRVYAMPHLGWEFTFAKHGTVGLEVGALVPIAPRTTVRVSLDSDGGLTELALTVPDVFGVKDLVEDKIKPVGGYPLPYAALRAGWMF